MIDPLELYSSLFVAVDLSHYLPPTFEALTNKKKMLMSKQQDSYTEMSLLNAILQTQMANNYRALILL